MSDSVTLPGGVEVTAEGGPVLLVGLAMLAAVLTIVFSLWIAFVVYRGYRRTGDRPALFLAAGIVLLASVSTSLRFVLDTAGLSLVATNSAAVASQVVGLGLILSAVYGQPDPPSHQRSYATLLMPLAVGSVLVIQRSLTGAQLLLVLINAATAGIGLFVAIQAFRGYRRHESYPMLYLALGVVLLTFVPFFLEVSLYVGTTMVAAGIGLARAGTELLGLAAILYSLTRA